MAHGDPRPSHAPLGGPPLGTVALFGPPKAKNVISAAWVGPCWTAYSATWHESEPFLHIPPPIVTKRPPKDRHTPRVEQNRGQTGSIVAILGPRSEHGTRLPTVYPHSRTTWLARPASSRPRPHVGENHRRGAGIQRHTWWPPVAPGTTPRRRINWIEAKFEEFNRDSRDINMCVSSSPPSDIKYTGECRRTARGMCWPYERTTRFA